jgi:cysteinyl-tRNA synthetase
MDAAAKSLERLRTAIYEWGEPGSVDEDFVERFVEQVNDDLNMPRAMALTWDLVKSDLQPAVKKATILVLDQVLGLRLGEWQPPEVEIPSEIQDLAQQRQKARQEKRWADADALRDLITAAGYVVEDTSEGPRIKPAKP